MKKLKKILALGVATMMAISAMSINALAVYNVPDDNSGISPYVNYDGAPSETWNLADGAFGDSMNGVSSSVGRGYSDRVFTTTSTKNCVLNVGNVDTNGTSGTFTFTVIDKSNGDIMRDTSGEKMVYSFTTNSNGEVVGTSMVELKFQSVSTFYFQIATSNPTTTKCYGFYTIMAE